MVDKQQFLKNEELWEEDLRARYPQINGKTQDEYRNYQDPERDTVKEFYRLNHQYQTLDFVINKQKEYHPLSRQQMKFWEAVEFLNTLVDDSDPDIELNQTQHLLQTSEAIRADGHPEWFIFAGFVHDLGKVLCLFGEPQWAVVGDTFPVGCAFSDKIVYPEFFELNPDHSNPKYNTTYGIYEPHCGLHNVHMSWGHDEYLYQVFKNYLPEPALYMLRYHSFYAQHQEQAYDHLMSEKDHEMFKWVKMFNPYDLYSKSPVPPNVDELRPYYERLAGKFLPEVINF